MMAATTANALIYPHTLFQLNLWRVGVAALFLVSLGTTARVVARAIAAAWESPGTAPSAISPVPTRAR
jgi:hypothetical protein